MKNLIRLFATLTFIAVLLYALDYTQVVETSDTIWNYIPEGFVLSSSTVLSVILTVIVKAFGNQTKSNEEIKNEVTTNLINNNKEIKEIKESYARIEQYLIKQAQGIVNSPLATQKQIDDMKEWLSIDEKKEVVETNKFMDVL